ncbi:MAG: glycosyltransferase family 39 protein [Cyanobacteria bacterium P01_F01_bin.150]
MSQVTLVSRYYRYWHRYWFWIIGILISLGILFRVIHLDQPVYWVDEVATSMRVSGYTQADVTQQLATGMCLSPSDILHFQQFKPGSSFFDLFSVLSKSPEHAPLYFLLIRFWSACFGTSVIAMRSLSVLFSLLALPAMFGLCKELFKGRRQKAEGRRRRNPPQAPPERGNPPLAPPERGTEPLPTHNAPTLQLPNSQTPKLPNSPLPWFATALLAISPFFISYAQEARPYSLWVLLLLVWHWLLWRSLQSNQLRAWLGYSLALALSLYTSLLTVLVLAGQSVAVMVLYRKRWRPYLIATGMALVAFLPWCWVIATHWQTLQANTSWMQEPMPLWALLGVWFYGLSVLFFDVPVAAGMPVILAAQMLTSLVVMVLMIYGVYALMTDGAWRRSKEGTPQVISQRIISPQMISQRAIGLFLLMGALGPPVALLTLDLIRDGQSAATPRYLMPMHLAVLIAVAYVVSDRLFYCPKAVPRGEPKDFPKRRQRRKQILMRWSRFWSRFMARCWPLLTAALLSISLLSCLIGIGHTSDYQKSRNLSNPAIIKLINQLPSPLVLTEADNIQDVISLSYGLEADVQFSILPPQTNLAQRLIEVKQSEQPLLIFNPSDAIQKEIQEFRLGTLTSMYQPTKLIASELGLTLWKLDAAP